MTVNEYMRAAVRGAAVLALGAGLGVGFGGPATAATEIIDSEFQTCTEINCSQTSIAGVVDRAGNRTVPWTAKFLAVKDACLRLEMTFIREAVNLEMTVVAPNPNFRYRDDQGGTACPHCALVKISPAPQTGYYTVVVSSANGAPVATDFHLQFGQYAPGNPNCTNPTPKLPPP
jgi:hypothetical protein